MDHKQTRIFNRILEKNGLPYKNTFVQYRNLKEFRNFFIERINPTHRIALYGNLKKPYIKDGHYNKIVKVGEILLSMCFVMCFDSFLLNIAINTIIGVILFEFLLEGIINDNWNRGQCWYGENRLSCAVS